MINRRRESVIRISCVEVLVLNIAAIKRCFRLLGNVLLNAKCNETLAVEASKRQDLPWVS